MLMDTTDSVIVTEHIYRLKTLAVQKIRAYSRLLDRAERLDAMATGDPVYGMCAARAERGTREAEIGALYRFKMGTDEAEIWDDLIGFLEKVSKEHHAGDN